VLYTVGNTDSGQAVLAASAKDGSIIWKQAVTEANPKHSYEGSRCTPTVVGDLLYVITSDGSIACLKTDGGAIVWQRKFSDWNGKLMSGWGFSESPLVDGDRVLSRRCRSTRRLPQSPDRRRNLEMQQQL
jgi:outer membrane protein assembly factor BamB